ncbi:MAG: thiamine diphosphokinase [Chlamydia sp. 32-24]|nr:MAG: thiamine diphosphokinase [Chlamydia sp. 32-24]
MQTIHSIALFANGPIANYDWIKTQIPQFEKIVTVDGGWRHCEKLGLVPDIVCGDFDSFEPKTHEVQQFYRFPKDKDYSDLEQALKIIYQPTLKNIVCFGALGNRTDHTLYNLFLLQRYPLLLKYISEEEKVIAIPKGKHSFSCSKNQCISLLPLGNEVKGVTTNHLKWNLRDASMNASFMSLSNICLKEDFSIEIKEGILLCHFQT